jgi:trehalose 6-phosphate synthase/phosphatase
MRLLIVSNRLPVSTAVDGESVSFVPASGGLATGLRGYHQRTGGLWIGWPGTSDTLLPAAQDALSQRLQQSGIIPVYLSATELREYYEECSNGTLWPVFHYLVERVPLSASSWNTYRSVNARFAEAIVDQYRPGDLIWIHD